MAGYLVHASKERVRFRHPIFGNNDKKLAAMELLKKSNGVVGIKPGVESILIFVEPEANVAEICKKLEEIFPQLAVVEAQKKASVADTAMPKKKVPVNVQNERRKFELKTMLTAGITTVTLAAIGLHHLHAWVGGAFALLATHHVWERRKRI